MSFLPKWRTMAHLASILLLGVFLACGGGNHHDRAGNLEVVNNSSPGSGLTLDHLFVTPSSSSTWGSDQLPPSPVLAPGDSLTLTRFFPDLYDVQARFSDGSKDEVFDVPIDDGVTTVLPMASTGNGTVTVTNEGIISPGLSITGVFLTLSTSSTFGPNQLDAPLFATQTLSLTGVSPGTYDLRVVFSDASFHDHLGFTVTSGLTISFIEN